MDFTEKYELLDSLTTGDVESFVARNRARGDRVLVHILQCEPQKPNQPTVQWVLDGLRKLAPEPVGIVLETGRYSGTAYAYVVTTLPDDAALGDWVERYNAQNRDTQEVESPDPETSDTKQISVIAAPPPAEAQPAQVPVHFTQIFRELDPQEKNQPSSGPDVAEVRGVPTPIASPANAAPHLSGERFPSAVHAAPNWDEVMKSAVQPKNEPPVRAPGAAPDFSAKDFPSSTPTPAANDSAKAGEFTSFWQGPFRGDAAPEIPVAPRSPLDSQKKPGEFTLMFRSGTAAPEGSVFTSTVPEENSVRSGLTGWATHAEIMATQTPADASSPPVAVPPAVENQRPAVVAPAKESPAPPRSATPAATPSAPTPSVFPLPTPPKLPPLPVITPAPSTPDAATSAFRPPVVEPVATSDPIPAGPSPYTQIISVKRPAAPPAEEAVAALPSFAATLKPAMPKPPAPKPPAAPKIAPAIKAPKAPKLDAPKLEAAKPTVSFWPLVLTLTALFFVAVLLVLYFVLKH